MSIQSINKECISYTHKECCSVIKKAILSLHGRRGFGGEGRGGGQTDNEGRSEVNINRNAMYNNLEH